MHSAFSKNATARNKDPPIIFVHTIAPSQAKGANSFRSLPLDEVYVTLDSGVVVAPTGINIAHSVSND